MGTPRMTTRTIKGAIPEKHVSELMRKVFVPNAASAARLAGGKVGGANPKGVCGGWCTPTVVGPGGKTLRIKRCKVTWSSDGTGEVRCYYG